MKFCLSITAKLFAILFVKKMPPQNRATNWSVTINNPVASDEENIALARQRGWKVEGQLEKGDNGTPHYQLMVKTPQVRFSALKKQFPRAHIEQARNVAALAQYVHKEETKVAELQTKQDRYPSMSKLWDMFYLWIDERKLFFQMVSWTPDDMLHHFDSFVEDMIIEGYYVEPMAVNPSVRSAVKKFGYAIICRSQNQINSQNSQTETDRQTTEEIVEVKSITHDDLEDGHHTVENARQQDST